MRRLAVCTAIALAGIAAWLPGAGPVLPEKPAGPAEAVSAARADASLLAKSALTETDLEAYRYFWVSAPEGKEREKVRTAFRLHVNLLSREPDMASIVEVRPWLWRVDMDETGWDRATLEAAARFDPFFHVQQEVSADSTFKVFWPGGIDSRTGEHSDRGVYPVEVKKGKRASLAAPWLNAQDIVALRTMLYSEAPIVSAEWFIAQSARQISANSQQTGLGYYDFLKLRDRDAYFKLLRFSEQDSIAVGKEIRAVSEFSGVSPLPRQFVRYAAPSGAVWVALDTTDARRKGVAINNLERGGFQHQIEEWYGFLPNGLPATFLSNEKGVRANNAPADAAGFRDDSVLNESKDGRIHVNLACLRCHGGAVLKPIDDYVRKVYQQPLALGVSDKKKLLTLRRQYFSNITRALKRDVEDYQDAFHLATATKTNPKGLDAGEAVKAYARVYHSYVDDPVTLERSARELGVDAKAWQAALIAQLRPPRRALDLRLAPLVPLAANPSLPIARATWEDVYPLAVEVSLGRIPVADDKAPAATLGEEK